MDVTFGHKMTEQNDSSYLITNINANCHSTHLAEGKGQNKYEKNIVEPEENVTNNLRYG